MVVLTAAIEKYAAQAKRREIRDSRAPGLHLVIQPKPSGAKSWCVRFRRPDGRPAKLTLGVVDLGAETDDNPVLGGALTLRQARELANRIDRERARGIDVVEERKAAKLRQRTESENRAANSFGAAVREFFADHRTKKRQTRPRRWRGDARLLGLDYPLGSDPATIEPKIIPGGLADIWRDKAVAAIDAHDVHAIVDESRKRGIPGLPPRNKGVSEARGRKIHAALSVLFGWLLQHRKVTSNPCVGVWHPGAPPARERILNDGEIVAFWRACNKINGLYGALFKVLLLTGCRLNEAAGMRRGEIVDNIWTIPTERTKNYRSHALTLSAPIQQIIAAAPRMAGGDYVFSATGAKPLTGWSRAKAQLDAAIGAVEPPFVLHDLRRTAASGMQRLGISDAVIERALNHVSGVFRGVAGTYQRDPLTAEVGTALCRWAAHVSGLVSAQADKVVKLRKRGK